MKTADFDSLTERVLGAAFEVANTLGAGFLEKVYERALLRELGLRGVRAKGQVPFAVTYKGHCVGEYFADILVEDVLAVELKCVDRLTGAHGAVHQLPACVGADGLPADQFPAAQARVAAHRPRV